MLNGIARRVALLACTVSAAALIAGNASAQAKHYKLAYDQPVGTGYHVGGLIFAEKLKELSKGQMIIDQYPGAQLGQEPQVLQLVKAGKMLADAGAPVIYEGWTYANGLMQLLAGDAVTPEEELVQRTFIKDNVQDLQLTPEAYLTSAWYGNDDFKAQYAAAWGLK